jgi:hypothetical protein
MDRRPPRNSASRPLVLVVEGHEDTRALYALALSLVGFDVVAEQDGADAFRRAREIRPDVVVTEESTVTSRRRVASHRGLAYKRLAQRDPERRGAWVTPSSRSVAVR